jgi:hypothetical protein
LQLRFLRGAQPIPFYAAGQRKDRRKGGDATALVWKSPALEKNNNPAFRVKMKNILYFRG